MRRIHVVTQKEAINEEKLKGCTAVVMDVFLATSTIIFLLQKNYQPVYAVTDSQSALELKGKLEGPTLLLGEEKGEPISGFHYPDPTQIEGAVEAKNAIICSTNGTKAITKAKKAKSIFISSLLNGHLVAEKIHEQRKDSSIVLICSGNNNRFSIEDFVGAGQIVHHLMNKGDYALSDSAKLARETYEHYLDDHFNELFVSETAKLLSSLGFGKSVQFVLDNFEKVEIVPILDEGKIIKHPNKTFNSNYEKSNSSV